VKIRAGILAGWDQQAGRQGGTWLAMDRKGRLGFLTNIFTGGVIDPEAAGRGFLILDWLRSEMGAEEYLMNLSRDSTKYNPFNLVLLEPVDEAYQAWRYTRGRAGHTKDFGPVLETEGFFGVGNHPQHSDTSYRKSIWGGERLCEIMREDGVFEKKLETMMTSKESFWPDEQILTQSVCEGQEGPFAKHGKDLSSVFVQVGDKYGTRTTTTVIIESNGEVNFREKDWQSGLSTEYTFSVV